MTNRHLVYLVTLTFLLCGCSGNTVDRPTSPVLIVAFYSTGGPGPALGHVKVFENGKVVVRNLAGEKQSRSFPQDTSFRQLVASLEHADFAEELSVIAAKRYEDQYADFEELYIQYGDYEVTLPTLKAEDLTPSVRQALKQLDSLALMVMEDQLDFQLNIEGRGSR